MSLDLTQLSQITEPLLAWYEKNARVLPWRENTDAYRVWVSEIMLQQTRVDTVIPYYERFLRRFPDVAALAAAPEQELLKMWEGLGYYSRVRNMQKAAQQICEKYNGIFPNEYEQLLSLPGIGAYTAGAVASIAWNKPYAAVDGNVLRVVTRLTADSREISNTKFKNEITAALQEIYPVDKCGIFTQSLMELGAVVCMPNGTPRCTECPLQSLCSACAAGTQPAYPVKKKKAQRRIEEKTVLLMIHAGRLALQKRAGSGLLGGMWELPNLSGKADTAQIQKWLEKCGITDCRIQKGSPVCHIFTHIEWHMDSYLIECGKAAPDSDFTWITEQALEKEYALPTAFKKVYTQNRPL